MWWYLLILLPTVIVLWLGYEWLEHTLIQYKTTTVECKKLPANTQLRLCLITDLHNNKKNWAKLIKQMDTFHPELILLAGDLINKHKVQNSFAEEFLTELNKLGIPVFYSAGNHELSFMEKYPEEWNLYLSKLPENITYLENRSVLLKDNSSLCISGLSLPKEFYKKGCLYQNREEMPKLSIPGHRFHILLAHHPEYAEFYEPYQADFIVSGHLHGGLLRLPIIGGLISPRYRLPKGYDSGLLLLKHGAQMFISRGLGSHTVPLRFLNRVEVNFLYLKGTKE